MLVVVFTFLFIDMFDTMGTIIGVHQGGGMADQQSKRDDIPGMDKMFLAIPSAATAPALIIVGVMMMPAVRRIHWEDYCRAIPAFLTIIIMPLAYSISDGILIGVLSYVVCHIVAGKFKSVSITMWVLAILFICKYIFI